MLQLDLQRLSSYKQTQPAIPLGHDVREFQKQEGSTGMLHLGTSPPNTREMDLDDIYLLRLKLLLSMSNAYIEGFPLGNLRRRTMLENALHVESESIDLGGLAAEAPFRHPSSGSMNFDHVFYQRVKLLTVMIKAIAKGYPMGEHRKIAMIETMDMICRAIEYNSQAGMDLLKIA